MRIPVPTKPAKPSTNVRANEGSNRDVRAAAQQAQAVAHAARQHAKVGLLTGAASGFWKASSAADKGIRALVDQLQVAEAAAGSKKATVSDVKHVEALRGRITGILHRKQS